MPKSTLDLTKLLSLPAAHYGTVSWDGSSVAFVWNVTGRQEIYVAKLPDGEPHNISEGRLPKSIRTYLVWNRAGTEIAFGWDEEDKERHALWTIDVRSGELKQLTDKSDVWHMPLEFSPDGSSLAFISDLNGPRGLFRLDLETKVTVALTKFPSPLYTAGQWSPDGTQLLASSNETEDLRNCDVYTVDAGGLGVQHVYQGSIGSQDKALGWLPNGKHIVLTSDVAGIERPGVLDLETGKVRWLGQADVSETAADVSGSGKYVLSLRNQDALETPIITNLGTGEETTLDLPAGVALQPQFALNDTAVVLGHTTPTYQIELCVTTIGKGKTQSLTPIDYGTMDPDSFVEPRHITYESSDGLTIPAILYEAHSERGKLPPAIVEIHGGPSGQARRLFTPWVQYWVSRGFTVLVPNFRGSTGYGREFFDGNYKDWGGGDLQDVVAGAEYLAREGLADRERIACYGGSYGGYLTYMALTKTPDVWKAGVAWVGLSDLLAAHEEGSPHMKRVLELLMGDPVENEALWRDRSPIHFAENLKAKLLIIHGVNDPRCPISQARAFRDQLLEHGFVEGEAFEYVELDKVGHGSSDLEQNIHTQQTIADFLIKNV
jgi:dipeptidyl aminopeptidase/acylaminoacyl peptidase